jgi:lysophospholipase L1-like esterase
MCRVLVIGSSIFEQWQHVSRVMPDCTVKNRALGGTITRYWTERLPKILPQELRDEASPDVVLFYCGSNDLNQDVTEETIIANILVCRNILFNQVPKAAFVYFGIIKAPQKFGKWEMIDQINKGVANNLQAVDLYIESNVVFVREGQPVARYFVEDGLHLTEEAYDALCDYSMPILFHWLKKYGNDRYGYNGFVA